MDRRASLEAFSEFLSGNNISADQQKFIETLIDHFENKGYIDPSQLFESPYKELHLEGVEGVFGDQSENIISIVDGINHMAIGN